MIADRNLDLSGLNCPQHVMRCKAALVKTPGGGLLQVVATDPRCNHDIQLLVRSQGDEIEHMETRAGVTEYWIRRHASAKTGQGFTPGVRHAAWFTPIVSGLWERLPPLRPAASV